MKNWLKKWLRRVPAPVLMPLAWAVGWAVVGGGVMEAFVDPRGKILDMWPQTLAIPGLIGGLAFFVVVRIAEGRRRFGDMSLGHSAAWGAVVGLLLGGLAMAQGVASGLFPGLWLRAAVIVGAAILLSVVAAVESVLVFRYAATQESTALPR